RRVTSADVPTATNTRPRGISTLRLIGLGSGSFGLAATWALYNTFMPLLLAPFVSSAGLRGTIMALDNVIAVLMLPLVGAWSDRVKGPLDRKSTRLNSSHVKISYAVFCLKKKKELTN